MATHLSPPPQTPEPAGPSERVSKAPCSLGLLSAPCSASGLDLEDAAEAAALCGSPEVFFFLKIFSVAQFQFLALCRLANSRPETRFLVIVEVDGKYSL